MNIAFKYFISIYTAFRKAFKCRITVTAVTADTLLISPVDIYSLGSIYRGKSSRHYKATFINAYAVLNDRS